MLPQAGRYARLPADWGSPEQCEQTRDIGAKWASELETAVLVVPSALVRRELNYLLNPLHADFTRIVFHESEQFNFGQRLVARTGEETHEDSAQTGQSGLAGE